jgi:hypothetical protein
LRPRGFFWSAVVAAVVLLLAAVPVGASQPSGERLVGGLAIEPAYNDANGQIIYLATPVKAPFPSHTNEHAVAPLYLVLYPPGTSGTFNCMGVPGNCPDHDGEVAAAATAIMPSVYGTDPTAVPGHDHLVDAPGGSEFNVPWHVYLELFTSTAAVTHITTEAQLDAAIARGDVIEVDSGIEFLCSVVSSQAYWTGMPIGG